MSEEKATVMDWNAIVTAMVGGLTIIGAVIGGLVVRWIARVEGRIDLNEQRIWDLKEQVPTKDDLKELKHSFRDEFKGIEARLDALIINTSRKPMRHDDTQWPEVGE